MSQEVTDSIKVLFRDGQRRFKAPTRSVTFYAHLCLAVLIGGGLGIWNTLYQCKLTANWDAATIAAALYTYFPAIVAAALIDFTHEKQPYLRSFGLLSATLFAILFFFSTTTAPDARVKFALTGAVLSVLFWWMANGEKDCFKDIDPSAATPEPSIKMPGDDTGWKK
jgi:hypothetical protein